MVDASTFAAHGFPPKLSYYIFFSVRFRFKNCRPGFLPAMCRTYQMSSKVWAMKWALNMYESLILCDWRECKLESETLPKIIRTRSPSFWHIYVCYEMMELLFGLVFVTVVSNWLVIGCLIRQRVCCAFLRCSTRINWNNGQTSLCRSSAFRLQFLSSLLCLCSDLIPRFRKHSTLYEQLLFRLDSSCGSKQ